ncbi:hypothetical protein MLD38_035369 [Melastoma candidum]|uniref:Uncharacterized protein n=2 Tax=Melastoma candidum TaxID=119954 RepID=A0ACB9LGU7_9MYRT|nr:hypothetical protein MLD38_035366 [Melastoma candidum]KAI4310387.1 hypothetical protein MLD38_035369 [Melastoma candidum]
MAAVVGGGGGSPRFYYRLERIQDFIGDRPLPLGNSNAHKTWLYITVKFEGGHLPVVDRGAYIVGLDSFTGNPHEEVGHVLSLAGVPWSSGSGNNLVDSIATGIQREVGSGGEGLGGGLGIVPLLVCITMVEEKVYMCSLCEEEVEDGEGEEPECGHVFHQDCIFDWLQEEDTCCPTCGYEIDMDR